MEITIIAHILKSSRPFYGMLLDKVFGERFYRNFIVVITLLSKYLKGLNCNTGICCRINKQLLAIRE